MKLFKVSNNNRLKFIVAKNIDEAVKKFIEIYPNESHFAELLYPIDIII